MDFPQDGGCLCGATRYRILEDPLIAYACHCTDCQTASGSSFALCLNVHLPTLEVKLGNPVERAFALPGGRKWSFRVCPECETRLWSERKKTPEFVNIRAGTLDDTSWVYPVGHIWVSSALPWSPITPDALQYQEQPDDPSEMIRAWRNRPRS